MKKRLGKNVSLQEILQQLSTHVRLSKRQLEAEYQTVIEANFKTTKADLTFQQIEVAFRRFMKVNIFGDMDCIVSDCGRNLIQASLIQSNLHNNLRDLQATNSSLQRRISDLSAKAEAKDKLISKLQSDIQKKTNAVNSSKDHSKTIESRLMFAMFVNLIAYNENVQHRRNYVREHSAAWQQSTEPETKTALLLERSFMCKCHSMVIDDIDHQLEQITMGRN